MITLYSFPNSRSVRVAWTLEELGLTYNCQHVALDKGEGQSAAHLVRHPDGKVPALEDGELTLFESAPICRYLAEQYGDGNLLPSSVTERAQVDQWLSFIVTEIEQPLWLQAKHKFALPQDKRVSSVLPTAAWEFQRALQALERRYDGKENLVGDSFTLADLFLAHTLTWATSMKHRLPESLTSYRERHMQRSAVTRAMEKEQTAAQSAM
ncbi:MAG: glutathione S-transferase family protein [Halomonas sp.]|uniref:glutathione S-transferase family protein n=1 Tax=unclassified Halomonas TaxID=2609666 RepID=UPI0009903A7E|nr:MULTISPECIES: glutathione S-transferase family protein [unclassified Halomonas]AQU84253.1 glutathione S-transferase [Halomonas sp. 'Soap Lake \